MAVALPPPLQLENSSLIVNAKSIPLDDIALISVRPPTNPRKSKDTFVHITLRWSLQKVGAFEHIDDAEEYAEKLADAVAAHRKRRAEQTGYRTFDATPLADHRISVDVDEVAIGKAVYPFARIRNIRKSAYGQPTYYTLWALALLATVVATLILAFFGGVLFNSTVALLLTVAPFLLMFMPAYVALNVLFPVVYVLEITLDTGQRAVHKTHDRSNAYQVRRKFDLWRKRKGENTPASITRRA